MNLSAILGKWYDSHKRNLPWRDTNDPYKIWISEIILQQTRVNQGISYYYEFLKNFPSLTDLASAPLDKVLKVWQGLGYYSRARNMHEAAKYILNDYNAQFPDDYYQLKKIKGIGNYTAAAIASIAFNKPFPVVDGNVYRVLSRLYGIGVTIESAEGKKQFYSIAEKLLDNKNPGRHNQAIMELGATVCSPANPHCELCPLYENCYAYLHNSIAQFPISKKRVIQKDRYFYYIIIRKQGHTYLSQRKKSDIWALLYEFPLIETDKQIEMSDLQKMRNWKLLFGRKNFKVLKVSDEIKHQLTHQIIHAWFIEVEVNQYYKPDACIEVEYTKINDYPLPRLIEKFWKSVQVI